LKNHTLGPDQIKKGWWEEAIAFPGPISSMVMIRSMRRSWFSIMNLQNKIRSRIERVVSRFLKRSFKIPGLNHGVQVKVHDLIYSA
jgi:hypothetical protein